MKSILILGLLIILIGCNDNSSGASDGSVEGIVPTLETNSTFNAKIPVIWIHPNDTTQSVIIGGTQADNLEIYNLHGTLLHQISEGTMNGIDLRYNFRLDNTPITLIATNKPIDHQLGFYTINPATLQLTNLGTRFINLNSENLCMYHSIITDKYYVIVMESGGKIQQWELVSTHDGMVDANRKRRFNIDDRINGCVADDQYAHLYFAGETAIWKYGAEPQNGIVNVRLETANPTTSLTLYYAQEQSGYLLASTKNDPHLLVYQRGKDNHFLGDFTINTGNGIDGIEQANGLTVTNVALNQTFSQGLLVAQDSENTEPSANPNYKFVAWEHIANTLNLAIDTSVKPRQIRLENNSDIKLVHATIETEPVSASGDAADDLAIWVHPQDTSLSTLIGTQKQGELMVYDLTGQIIQTLPDGKMNNVDLRDDFPLGVETITLVAASNRTNNSIALYKINPNSRQLENVAARTITVGLEKEAYGLCMYHNPLTHQYYVFVNNKNGQVEQWKLVANLNGQVDGQLVRRFEVGSQTEGCVADDELGQLYIGEEQVGIWKYSAKPNGGEKRTLVDSTGTNGHLTADVEGLAIYNAGQGNGYLLVSSQGNNTFSIYQRTGNNEYIGTFQIGANEAIDGVSDSDGIEVINVPLGTSFPFGVFVAQDGWNSNPVANQNFKLVPWEQIANRFGLLKNID